MARKAAENREEEILRAAVKTFSEKGFNAATTSEIAKEAGIAEGTLFRYFKNKKELLNKVFVSYSQMLSDELIKKQVGNILIENKDKPPKEILKILILDRIKLIEKNIDVYRIILTEIQYQQELKEAVTMHFVHAGKNVLAKFIEEGIVSENFRSINVLIAIRTLIGMVGMYLIQNHLFPGLVKLNTEEQVDEMVDLFLHGISKQ
ncbi:TetR/AcrR family transcriptional regulator [Clostridium sp. 19966]|uniref:TetR/AcrR family transcriptional regulator n=1 Tax=Clostridium sp. 19966 TaxID=2768166 RepID=UPI0028DF5C68|nr:TetR/AcrR family transcriptional regulator [Clostridium sp. 19966]MDT8716832.1 TetR/AcrR family transcriptional regulator [Clostridium sp. 19966]